MKDKQSYVVFYNFSGPHHQLMFCQVLNPWHYVFFFLKTNIIFFWTIRYRPFIPEIPENYTSQKNYTKTMFSVKDFFNKCDQMRSFLRIRSYLLKKSLMENFIFCAVKVKRIFLSSIFRFRSESQSSLKNTSSSISVCNQFPSQVLGVNAGDFKTLRQKKKLVEMIWKSCDKLLQIPFFEVQFREKLPKSAIEQINL